MASTSSSSENGNAVRYRQTLDLVIEGFTVAKKQDEMEFEASAFNEELRIYGDEMRKSRWILYVQPQEPQEQRLTRKRKSVGVFLALEAPCDIELFQERTEISILDWKGEKLFSKTISARRFKGVDARQRPLDPEDYMGLRRYITFDELTKKPEFTTDDVLRIRAEIIFTVISGGVKPNPGVPAISPVLAHLLREPASTGPYSDEFLLISSDGRRFCIEKQLLNGIPHFEAIVESIKNPQEGIALLHDGETLEIVFDSLKGKRVMSQELSKKVLIAADTFGLENLQMEAMTPLVTDMSIEKAAEVFKFATENNIASLRARVFTLIPYLLEKVSGANAAKALVLASKMGHSSLRKKALDVIAQGLTDFVLAGGMEEISVVSGLATEVREAVAEYVGRDGDDGQQKEAPAKKQMNTFNGRTDSLVFG